MTTGVVDDSIPKNPRASEASRARAGVIVAGTSCVDNFNGDV
jgi:hypothetical protein